MAGWSSGTVARSRHSYRPSVLHFPSCSCSAATGGFLIGDGLEDLEVHRGARLDAGDFAGDLGPMPGFGNVSLRPAACSSRLRFITGIDRIGCCQLPGVFLPAAADFAAAFDPFATVIRSSPTPPRRQKIRLGYPDRRRVVAERHGGSLENAYADPRADDRVEHVFKRLQLP